MQFRLKPAERLAVCSWSLQAPNPQALVEKILDTGIRRVQLALDPLRESPEIWGGTEAIFRENKVEIVSGMFGCLGEDYSTLETIRTTGGIAPDATWAANLKNIHAVAGLANRLELQLVTFHAGFLPHEKSDPSFLKMLDRLRMVADIFATQNISVGLETGQETAVALAALLTELKRPNVGVNFDPANMILYGKGNPVEALLILSPWLQQVHLKDATGTKVPGTWGTEVAVGSGEVNWPDFFTTLSKLNFTGNLIIEREAGEQRVKDIIAARELATVQLEN